MGMTIDNSISDIEMVQTQLEIANQPRSLAFDTAISTMRKYQKIEEIVKFGNANELGFEYVGEKITEVIEDGNDD